MECIANLHFRIVLDCIVLIASSKKCVQFYGNLLNTCIHWPDQWLTLKIYRYGKHRVRANWTLQAHFLYLSSFHSLFTLHTHTYGYEIFLWVSLAKPLSVMCSLCVIAFDRLYLSTMLKLIVSRWYTYAHTYHTFFCTLFLFRRWYSCCLYVLYLVGRERDEHNITFSGCKWNDKS